MRIPIMLPFLLTVLLSSATALYYKDLTPSTFDELLDPEKAFIMIEFYAPWCGHCTKLAPEYEKLGATFETSTDVIIAQVNADAHRALAKRFKVTGYPTLKWVPKGGSFNDVKDVTAERTAAHLLKFINTKTGMSMKLKGEPESAVEELSPANFQSRALDTSKHSFVGFFAPWCGHCKALKPAWEKLASLYADEHDVVIGAIDCDAHQELAEQYEVKGFPTIKYFGSNGVEDYTGGRDLADFVKFLNEKSGLDFAPDGGLMPTAGIVEQISEHVKSYLVASTEEERSKIIGTCEQAVKTLDDKAQSNFKYYIKVFAKISAKGGSYIRSEKERLSKILHAGSSLKSSQKKSFIRRINVLNSFDEL